MREEINKKNLTEMVHEFRTLNISLSPHQVVKDPLDPMTSNMVSTRFYPIRTGVGE